MNRPFERRCRSLAVIASVIGVRANATAIAGAELEPLGVLRREHEREERIVVGLGGDAAVVAGVLERRAPARRCSSNDPPSIPSTFIARALTVASSARRPDVTGVRVRCHTPAVPSDR